jgi:hypothetical protein
MWGFGKAGPAPASPSGLLSPSTPGCRGCRGSRGAATAQSSPCPRYRFVSHAQLQLLEYSYGDSPSGGSPRVEGIEEFGGVGHTQTARSGPSPAARGFPHGGYRVLRAGGRGMGKMARRRGQMVHWEGWLPLSSGLRLRLKWSRRRDTRQHCRLSAPPTLLTWCASCHACRKTASAGRGDGRVVTAGVNQRNMEKQVPKHIFSFCPATTRARRQRETPSAVVEE